MEKEKSPAQPIQRQSALESAFDVSASPGRQLAPPQQGLQAQPAQAPAAPLGRLAQTAFGDYWVVPDSERTPQEDAQAEQLTETEFASLTTTWQRLNKSNASSIKILETTPLGTTKPGFKAKILAQFAILLSKPMGRALIISLVDSKSPIVIRPSDNKTPAETRTTSTAIEKADGTANRGSMSTILVDNDLTDTSKRALDEEGNRVFSPVFAILGHELIHAKHNAEGRNHRKRPSSIAEYTNLEEQETIDTGAISENGLRDEHGVARRFGAKSSPD